MAEILYNKINREVLIQNMLQSKELRTTLSFYRYVNISNPWLFRDHLYTILSSINVLGRIYLAHEGINGQISVPTEHLNEFKNKLNEIEYLKNIRLNIAIEDNGKSFFKLKIKVRNKIVADGLSDLQFDASKSGKHLNAIEFNELTDQLDTIVVDMRNHYESEVGKFENALTPDVSTFREALPTVAAILEDKKDQHIVMYCTGGIRCEKASAYMKHLGFNNVYQLDGGIIEYTNQIKSLGIKNKFIGKNFVFDERLGERISETIISTCHQCGNPSDRHVNCLNDQCHILFIQCDVCAEKYSHCCSVKCLEFEQLDAAQKANLKNKLIFNGTQFSKGKYKALGKDDHLILD